MGRRSAPGLIVIGLVLTLSACGTTVPLATQVSTSGTDSNGDAVAAPTSSGAPLANGAGGTSTGPASGGIGSGAGGAASVGSGSVGAAAGANGSASAPLAAQAAKGAPVEVGALVIDGYDQFYKDIGVNLSFGDQRAHYQIVADEVNRTGGIAGHPIKLVFGVENVESSQTTPTQEQAVCNTWTQDNHVQAAMVSFRAGTLAGCLAKAKVPLYMSSVEDYTANDFKSWPLAVAPGSQSEEIAVTGMVDTAADQGWFKPRPQDAGAIKVGYLYYDTPEQTRVAKKVFEPLLEAHGVKASDITSVAISYPQSTSDGYSTAVPQIDNSVLTFKSAGVNHMMILDNGGNITYNFPTAADKEKFTPLYAWDSFNVIGIEQDYVPKAQLTGSVGGGGGEIADVHEADAPKKTAVEQRCANLMTKGGQSEVYGPELGSEFLACNEAFTLQAGANAAGTIAPSALIHATENLGVWPLAGIAGSVFKGGPFSASGGYALSFVDSCQCIRYHGPFLPLK